MAVARCVGLAAHNSVVLVEGDHVPLAVGGGVLLDAGLLALLVVDHHVEVYRQKPLRAALKSLSRPPDMLLLFSTLETLVRHRGGAI